jgi:membrane-associated phospholipid phosphatase
MNDQPTADESADQSDRQSTDQSTSEPIEDAVGEPIAGPDVADISLVGHADPPPVEVGPLPIVPGQGQFGPLIDTFDERFDALLELLRGHPLTDRLFITASHLGDFSVIWQLVGIGRGIVLRRPDQVVLLAAMLGTESLFVNQGVKRVFRRQRPTETGDDRLPVRRPTTSSFPSGHASSAAFAAMVLSGWDGPRVGVVWWKLAALVAVSRAYVRIHHGSDVVAGAVLGTALGVIGRRVARRWAP